MLPLSRISAGSFRNGLMSREYSSFSFPGCTAVGTSSILSIRPELDRGDPHLARVGRGGRERQFHGFLFLWFVRQTSTIC